MKHSQSNHQTIKPKTLILLFERDKNEVLRVNFLKLLTKLKPFVRDQVEIFSKYNPKAFDSERIEFRVELGNQVVQVQFVEEIVGTLHFHKVVRKDSNIF